MNTHTTEQLLMCEKSDLVKYIEELREQKEGAFTEGYEEAEEELCVDKEYLDEKEDEIKKLKQWSLSKDMIETTSAETIEEFEGDVRDNWTELEELKEEVEGWKASRDDDIREAEGSIRDELEELKEEHKQLKDNNKSFKNEIKQTINSGNNSCYILLDQIKDVVKENEKLKIDHRMNINYYRCYLSYADPKGYATPEKEHIDNWCKNGDTVDEKLKEYLYDGFCIDEEEDE